jgi:predicted transcriptional regulator
LLLPLLRESHTVECLARRTGASVKTIRRDLARLQSVGFVIRSRWPRIDGPKYYWAENPRLDFKKIINGK